MGVALDIAGALGNKALDWVDTAVHYYNQKKLNRQANKDTQQNMELAHRFNLQSVADSYVHSIAGMRRAGINPSQAVGNTNNAVGVSASAGNAGAAGMPKNSVAETLMASNELELQKAQKANLDAATRKTDAETAEIHARTPNYQLVGQGLELSNEQMEVMNRRLADADKTVEANLNSWFDWKINTSKDVPTREMWQSIANLAREDDMTVGTLMAMQQFTDYLDSLDEFEKNMVLRATLKKINEAQMDDNQVFESLVRQPLTKQIEMLAHAGEMLSEKAFRDAYREVLMPIEADLKLRQELTMRHDDFVGLVKDGDYAGAVEYLIPAVTEGLAFAGGMYLTRGKSVAGLRTTPVGPLEKGSVKAKAEVERRLQLSRNEIKSLKHAERSAANNKRLGELYREERELQERLNKFRPTDYAR